MRVPWRASLHVIVRSKLRNALTELSKRAQTGLTLASFQSSRFPPSAFQPGVGILDPVMARIATFSSWNLEASRPAIATSSWMGSTSVTRDRGETLFGRIRLRLNRH